MTVYFKKTQPALPLPRPTLKIALIFIKKTPLLGVPFGFPTTFQHPQHIEWNPPLGHSETVTKAHSKPFRKITHTV